MATRTTVRAKNRKLCVGDLKHQIRIKDRQIGAPAYDEDTGLIDPDFIENFGVDKDVVRMAAINTLNGKVMFDGVGTDRTTLTHEVLTYYDEEVTAENWIVLDDGRLLDIHKVEVLDERNLWMRLLCVERGEGEAAKA